MKSAKAPRRVCVLVLGMHGSGGSAFARVLNLLGCDLPDSVVQTNEAGLGESDALRQFNDRILASAGARWDDWLEFHPGWLKSPRAEEFRDEALELLRQEFGSSRLFVLDDPRMCRLVPFWLEVFKAAGVQPLILSPVRSPQAVAAALKERDGFSPGLVQLMWLRHVLDAEFASRGTKRFFTSYDRLTRGWARTTTAAGSALGIAWPRLSDKAAVEIEAFLSQDCRDGRQQVANNLDNSMLSDWLRSTSEILTRWSAEGESPQDHGRLDEIRTAMNAATPAFSPLLGTEQARAERLEMELASERQQASQVKSELESRAEAAEQEWASERQRLEQAAAEAENDLAELRHRLAQTESALAQRSHEAEQTAGELAAARDELRQTEAARNATETALAHSETARTEAETARAESETARAESDAALAESEAARAESDAARTEAETARAEAEAALAESVAARAESDAARAEAEAALAESEAARAKSDAARAEAEAALAESEAVRAKSDAARAEADAARAESEKARAEAETVSSGLKQHLELLLADVRQRQVRAAEQADTDASLARQAKKVLAVLDTSRQELSIRLSEAEQVRVAQAAELQQRASEIEALKQQRLDEIETLRQQHLDEIEALKRAVEETQSELQHQQSQSERLRQVAAIEIGRAAGLVNGKGTPSFLRRFQLRRQAALLKRSGLFDAEWYLRQNADVAGAGIDPLRHYVEFGAREGRAPNPGLTTSNGKA